MTLTTEQHRWLTEEFLGLCWHEASDLQSKCKKCGAFAEETVLFDTGYISEDNPDFTDWRTFGLLKKKLLANEKWYLFQCCLMYKDYTGSSYNPGDEENDYDGLLHIDYLEPEVFALAIYKFFNGET